jgi:hypothetical protein
MSHSRKSRGIWQFVGTASHTWAIIARSHLTRDRDFSVFISTWPRSQRASLFACDPRPCISTSYWVRVAWAHRLTSLPANVGRVKLYERVMSCRDPAATSCNTNGTDIVIRCTAHLSFRQPPIAVIFCDSLVPREECRDRQRSIADTGRASEIGAFLSRAASPQRPHLLASISRFVIMRAFAVACASELVVEPASWPRMRCPLGKPP